MSNSLSANLSRDYFTNRQDRYIEFANHPPLADFFSSLVTLTCSYSFRVLASDTTTPHPKIDITWPSSNPFPFPPFSKPRLIPAYVNSAFESYQTFINSWTTRSWQSLASPLPPFPNAPVPSKPPSTAMSYHPSFPPPPYDTTLRPVIQMFPFSLAHETDLVVPEIFKTANALATAPGGGETTVDWTSGYFGLRDGYKKLVLGSKAKIQIVSASPEVTSPPLFIIQRFELTRMTTI